MAETATRPPQFVREYQFKVNAGYGSIVRVTNEPVSDITPHFKTKSKDGSKTYTFLTFESVSGKLTGKFVTREKEGTDDKGNVKKWYEILVEMEDKNTNFLLSLGSHNGVGAQSAMKALCDPRIPKGATVYACNWTYNKKDGTKGHNPAFYWYEGTDRKFASSRYFPANGDKPENGTHLKDMPGPEKDEITGNESWTTQSKWVTNLFKSKYEKVDKVSLKTNFPASEAPAPTPPASSAAQKQPATQQATQPAAQQATEPESFDDDLPF